MQSAPLNFASHVAESLRLVYTGGAASPLQTHSEDTDKRPPDDGMSKTVPEFRQVQNKGLRAGFHDRAPMKSLR